VMECFLFFLATGGVGYIYAYTYRHTYIHPKKADRRAAPCYFF
jgi:hypothetical protein